jgi:DNA-directed RNA polymerase specialized sigma24 family protein
MYRYFAGYSAGETAELLEVTERTINRDWQKARAFLSLALEQPMGADGSAAEPA